MGCGERHEGGLEKFKGINMLSNSPEVCLSPVNNFTLSQTFPIRMSGRRLKDKDRIRKIVLLAQGPYIGKPRSVYIVLVIIEESVAPMLVKNMVRTKSGYHTKMTKDLEIKETSCMQTPSKEHDRTLRGCLVEAL
jgi:hypothetical protein